MNPEDLMRELRDPANWNAKPTIRTDVFPARRRWSPLVVSLATVAAVAVVLVIVFSAVGGSVRGLRQPAVPPVPSNSATPTATNPVPSGSPVPVTYSGSATCSNLVDTATLDSYKAKGWVDVSASYIAQSSLDPTWVYRGFIDTHGIVCAWGLPGASAKDTVSYAYGPISEKLTQDYESADGMVTTYVRDITYLSQGSRARGAYAFGHLYWAASFDTGQGQVLDEVVANAPEFGRPVKQSTLYATSEGLGDIRIGQSLTASSLVTWTPNFCHSGAGPYSGAWVPNEPFDRATTGHRVIDVVTSTGYKNGPVDLIWIESPEIPTKSGIRVGDSEAKLKATFPNIGKPVTDRGDVKTYVVTGTAGEVLFDVAYPSTAGDPAAPVLEVVTIRIIPKGSEIPMWGGDAGGSCKG